MSSSTLGRVRSGARRASLVALLLVSWPAPGWADASSGIADRGVTGSGLRTDWTVDGVATGAALAAWGALELAKNGLVPSPCRWCSAPGVDRDVRSALAWSNPEPAKAMSTALLVSIPAGFVAYDLVSTHGEGGIRDTAQDILVVAEAIAVTGIVTDAVKYAVARQRPYAVGATAPLDSDSRVSFWSGHVSLTFAAAAAAGSVAQRRGYAGWQWVYGAGFAGAAATGYFRLAGDQHWLTDVLAGAAAGTAIGFLVPWLHRSDGSSTTSFAPLPGGFMVSGQF